MPVNKPRPIYSKKTGQLTGYKQEVKWRGQRYYFTCRTVAAAEACWRRAIDDLEAGRHPYDKYRKPRGAPEAEVATIATEPAMTVGDWIARWSANRNLKPRTARNHQYCIDVHILPMLGHLPIATLTRLEIQEWVWALEEEYAPRYVRTIFAILRVALLDAVAQADVPLDATPAVRIRIEPPDPTDIQALTPEQVAAVATRCGVHEPLVWSLAFTGARIGELLARDVGDWSPFHGLTIAGRPVESDVDADAEARPRRRKKGVRKARASKTSAGARTIELCASHGAMLRDHLRGRTSGPLFLNSLDRRPKYQGVYDATVKAVTAARADGVDIPEGVTPHWFRHTHKTWLREDRCDPVAVDERLGHSSKGMDKVYVHTNLGAMRAEILAAVEDRWRQAHGATSGTVAEAR